jgi:hypothetical protein
MHQDRLCSQIHQPFDRQAGRFADATFLGTGLDSIRASCKRRRVNANPSSSHAWDNLPPAVLLPVLLTRLEGLHIGTASELTALTGTEATEYTRAQAEQTARVVTCGLENALAIRSILRAWQHMPEIEDQGLEDGLNVLGPVEIHREFITAAVT